MNKALQLFLVLTLALLGATSAFAAPPSPRTFVATLNTADEVPACPQATNAARGHFVMRVVDESAGTVEWKLVANNLPGTITAAHIHLAPAGEPGPVVQPLALVPGAENGVIGSGSFTNPALLAAMVANPDMYYVNVHSATPEGCPSGAIRGQFGDHGPAR